MSERLFGLETEYALSLLDRRKQRIQSGAAIEWVMDSARRCWPHLPGVHSAGLFLQSGARFYVDCGAHPELTTPECPNPWDVARYLRAGDRLLLEVAQDLQAHHPEISDAGFFRHNVDYSGRRSTWGSHESYLHRASPALFRRHLIPHLVSRLIYTGAGGFDSLYPGIRFTLSPRVPHLQSEVSHESTHSRGILHTKDETLSAQGYHRLHLLCSESLFSERAIFLRVGATALVVALIEAGVRPADGLVLPNPLEAMRAFAADPRCQTPAGRGGQTALTAMAIQRHYLELAEQNLTSPHFPPWAGEVCQHWRAMLDRLETNCPASVATQLDWAIKHSVFEDHLHRRGTHWAALADWNAVIEKLAAQLAQLDVALTRDVLRHMRQASNLSPELQGALEASLRGKGLTLDGLIEFLALRDELFELDTRFGQLGERGIFAALDRAGVLRHQMPGVDNIEHAMAHPPAIGRARLRGECVRRFSQPGATPGRRARYACDWTVVHDYTQRRVLDISDPFVQEEVWREIPQRSRRPADSPDAAMSRLRELQLQLRQRPSARPDLEDLWNED